MLIYKYGVFSYLLVFWNFVHKFRRDWSTCAWEKIHSFYAFELMIQFLAEEGFLNMHSDILMNLTPRVWIVLSTDYFSFQNVFNNIF